MANELFKEEAAGTDFKLAILKLMNLIKKKSQFPKVMELCNITSIYKNWTRRPGYAGPIWTLFGLILDHIGPTLIYLEHSVFLDHFIWTRLFGSVSLDPSIWTCLF